MLISMKPVRGWVSNLRSLASRKSPVPDSSPTIIAREWKKGYYLIPSVRLVRKLQASSKPRNCWPIYLLVTSEWPLALNLFLDLVHPEWAAVKGRAMVWFAGFGACVALMFLSAWVAWTFAGERAHLVDNMIVHRSERVNIACWLARFMVYRRQLILPLIGVISAPIYLYLVRGSLEKTVAVAFPSYVMVSWTSFVGGNVLYWLWVAPGVAKRVYQCTELNLRWQDPASTPGMRLLADGYGLSALFVLSGVFSISVLGFFLPKATVSKAELYLLFTFFTVAVFTSIRIGVTTFIWIWATITREKRSVLASINGRIPTLKHLLDAERGNPDAEVGRWAELYQTVAAAPGLPFSTSAMVQYGAALAGAVVAFAISLVSRFH